MKPLQLTSRTIFNSLLLCTIVWSCSKKNSSGNPYTLPTATQTGADVMACYFDSSIWIINNNDQETGFFTFGLTGSLNDTFSVSGYPIPSILNHFQALHLFQLEIFNHFQIDTSYAVTDRTHIIFQYFPDSSCQNNGYEIPTVNAASGTTTVTKFDNTNRIISGLFNAKFIIPGCYDTISLRNGWFDFKF